MQRHLQRLTPFLVGLALAGCSDDETTPPTCSTPAGACGTQLCDGPVLEAQHEDVCTVLSWPTNPPTSGPHYQIWAAFQHYDAPVPRGFWLHSVEHSGVALLYNCDLYAGDCADLQAELRAFTDGLDPDPLCTAPVRHRVFSTPDPLLDVAVAAVAWGHSLEGSCFDESATSNFVAAYYGKNYENFCTGGVDPTDPDEGFPANCGQ